MILFVLAAYVRSALGLLSDLIPNLEAQMVFKIFMGIYDISFFALPYVFAVSFTVTNYILLRREGAGFKNLLAAGCAVLILMNQLVFPLIYFHSKWSPLTIACSVVSIFCTYFIYLQYVYSLAMVLNLRHIRNTHGLQYVVVLGCGLIGSRVPPLLGARVKKGVQVYQHNPGAMLIMSGGKGSDDVCAEGAAMAQYAEELGVPSKDILVEDRSTTTEENLAYSEAVLQKDAGHPAKHPETAVVTSAYHLLRALIMAKRQKMPCIGFGSVTKSYYALNAMVREYIAFLVKCKRINILLIGGLITLYLLGIVGITNGIIEVHP